MSAAESMSLWEPAPFSAERCKWWRKAALVKHLCALTLDLCNKPKRAETEIYHFYHERFWVIIQLEESWPATTTEPCLQESLTLFLILSAGSIHGTVLEADEQESRWIRRQDASAVVLHQCCNQCTFIPFKTILRLFKMTEYPKVDASISVPPGNSLCHHDSRLLLI